MSRRSKEELKSFVDNLYYAVNLATSENLKGEELAERIMTLLYERLGGTLTYIPKIDSVTRSSRDELIVEKYNGKNIKELSRMFGLSEQWIYRILSKAIKKKREEEERQDETN